MLFDSTIKELDGFMKSLYEDMTSGIPINVIRNEKEYIIQTTIQSKEFASLEIDNGKLKICTKYPHEGENYYVKEIFNGCRSLKFQDANMDGSRAEMYNNLLQIRIPIEKGSIRKHITIQ
eukprot:NODE_343_length_9136_cov_0.948656.p10 type:complete len:120 gc:universal NODE_343_length_9136_cov_0.948656:3025-3384(+)